MHAVNLLDSGCVHPFLVSGPKASGLPRVGREHVYLVAVGGELLGETPDQNGGPVDRREVALRGEEERAAVSQVARHVVYS
jgi:hypothetical protein